MTLYRNNYGHDRVLMVDRSSGVKVPAGETIEITDEGLQKGLVGQEAVWQPVTEPDNETVEE